MRLRQAINEKIHMYDRIILALSRAPGADDPDEVEVIFRFVVEERQRLRAEVKELDDGTHPIFA